MSNYSQNSNGLNISQNKLLKKDNYFLHAGLFLITFVTATIAGMEWTTGSLGPFEFELLSKGLPYSISILTFLSFHEFGHYFAAKIHGVNATLPFYIPFPPIAGFLNFGTMGAVIKTKTPVQNNKAMFDIGAAGPIAGFLACLVILIYGFTNLPDANYILSIHPDYFSPEYGKDALSLEFGDTLLFAFMRFVFTTPDQFVPPMSEIYHYPYLCVGWFGLFVTAMNMIPVGQLDGGHIVYSMFGGKIHERVAQVFMSFLIIFGFLGVADSFLGTAFGIGWAGWLFWAFILYIVIKVKHPPVYQFEKLDSSRMVIGYISLLILLLSFSPTPFIVSF